MCGRYSVAVSPEEISEAFEAPVSGPVASPRWNVAPTQDAPVVLVDGEGRRSLRSLRWGLVPHWAETRAGPLRINARSESAATNGAFREAFARRRCLVPADGFYEWRKIGARKQPFWIHHQRGGLLGLAGLWERWCERGGEPLETFTILTTLPNAVVAPLHSRMPVVLPPGAWSVWLDPAASIARLVPLLAPAPDDLLAARAVSPLMSRGDVDDPRCIEALVQEPSELIDLFEGR